MSSGDPPKLETFLIVAYKPLRGTAGQGGKRKQTIREERYESTFAKIRITVDPESPKPADKHHHLSVLVPPPESATRAGLARDAHHVLVGHSTGGVSRFTFQTDGEATSETVVPKMIEPNSSRGFTWQRWSNLLIFLSNDVNLIYKAVQGSGSAVQSYSLAALLHSAKYLPNYLNMGSPNIQRACHILDCGILLYLNGIDDISIVNLRKVQSLPIIDDHEAPKAVSSFIKFLESETQNRQDVEISELFEIKEKDGEELSETTATTTKETSQSHRIQHHSNLLKQNHEISIPGNVMDFHITDKNKLSRAIVYAMSIGGNLESFSLKNFFTTGEAKLLQSRKFEDVGSDERFTAMIYVTNLQGMPFGKRTGVLTGSLKDHTSGPLKLMVTLRSSTNLKILSAVNIMSKASGHGPIHSIREIPGSLSTLFLVSSDYSSMHLLGAYRGLLSPLQLGFNSSCRWTGLTFIANKSQGQIASGAMWHNIDRGTPVKIKFTLDEAAKTDIVPPDAPIVPQNPPVPVPEPEVDEEEIGGLFD